MNSAEKAKFAKLKVAGAIDPYSAVKNLNLKGKRKTDGDDAAKRLQKDRRMVRKAAKKDRKENKQEARNRYTSQMMAIYKVRFQRKTDEKKALRDRYGRGAGNKDE